MISIVCPGSGVLWAIVYLARTRVVQTSAYQTAFLNLSGSVCPFLPLPESPRQVWYFVLARFPLLVLLVLDCPRNYWLGESPFQAPCRIQRFCPPFPACTASLKLLARPSRVRILRRWHRRARNMSRRLRTFTRGPRPVTVWCGSLFLRLVSSL